MRLKISASGLDKSQLTSADFVTVDQDGRTLHGRGEPSDETLLHLTIARARSAGAIMHTHSVWSTLLSGAPPEECRDEMGGLVLRDHEMLKGLEGITTHEHIEVLPIIDNSQDYTLLAHLFEESLQRQPETHGILVRRHGLYTWGRDVDQARQHVEILEFLLEVTGRAHGRPAAR